MTDSQLSLRFLGAAGTVTGSRYLLQADGHRVLVDCGLFQGYKHLRQRNWKPFPVDPAGIDAVYLSHAHLDHSGYVPVLASNGFDGPVYCTAATAELCEILWLDAGKLQEEEAAYLNRHKFTRHEPALPLFDQRQAEAALRLLQPVATGETAGDGPFEARFHPNGHIIGSAYIELHAAGRRLLFSGDLGRPQDNLMHAPQPPCATDYLVIESTYGDRLHARSDVREMIGDIVNETLRKGGTVLVPAFAVGRAQAIMHLLFDLRQRGEIPPVPIHLDSPMAIKATEVMARHTDWHRLSAQTCRKMCEVVDFVRTVEESQALNQMQGPRIIIAASGMATGGRVLHHLKFLLGKHNATVLFAGYQAGGTRGARLVHGEPRIKIHGEYYQVNARIESLDNLSAHADYSEVLDWLRQMPVAPKATFITHGEPEAADALRLHLQEELGWAASVADMGEEVAL